MFINTLPLRVDIDGTSVRDGVRATHARLTDLLGHEHASLALAQRCSGVAAPLPLFSAMLNYRHGHLGERDAQARQAWQGIEVLTSEERTNYPLSLNVDDLGDAFRLVAQVAEVGVAAGSATTCRWRWNRWCRRWSSNRSWPWSVCRYWAQSSVSNCCTV